MKPNTITVLRIEPGQSPIVKEIGNDLKSMQAEVEGYIECISFPNGCVVVCNDEGKLNGMSPNRQLGLDIICGPFIVCDTDRDGNFASMSKSKLAEFSQLFSEIPEFTGQEPELNPRITFTTFDY